MLSEKDLKTCAIERAEAARVVEYLRCMTEDAALNERILEVHEQSISYNEAVDEEETREIMDAFRADGDEGKDSEINAITSASSDISFDEMIGIHDSITAEESAFMVEDVLFNEGATSDMMAIDKKLKKQILSEVKLAKKCIKSKDNKKAKEHLTKAQDDLKELKKQYNDIYITSKNSGVSFITGTMIKSLINFGIRLGLGLTVILSAGIFSPVAAAGSLLLTVNDIIAFLKKLIHDVKGGDITIGTFNSYSNQVFNKIDTLDKTITDLKGLL